MDDLGHLDECKHKHNGGKLLIFEGMKECVFNCLNVRQKMNLASMEIWGGGVLV